MGIMISGVWHDTETTEVQKDGQFIRKESSFRNWITVDGSPGPTGKGGFRAESGRYHLYVSYACPWAHRALIYRCILGLQDAIDISVVHPVNLENGWEFSDYPAATGDKINSARYLYEVYARADPSYSGKVTVPVLWDLETSTIVNNESSEVMRMIGGAFRSIAPNWIDFYPEDLGPSIDELNEFIYVNINNGVYRCGFARTQDAYDKTVTALFAALDKLDDRLNDSQYLFGDRIVEADWRLFTTLIRFDPVYYFHFKCNRRPLRSYINIMRYTSDLLNYPGIRGTIYTDHIIDHYYLAHRRINPMGIIPVGARMNLDGPPWRKAASKEEGAC
ncbi:MAG: glutathione S-transferase family protein [Nitrospira sp.]|nr:glutathione S-transferase family protein [Nitrospira sp.]